MNASAGDVLPGLGLSPEEEAVISSQLRRCVTDGLQSASFWGRIVGSACDYLIVAGVPRGASSPRKHFYFATSAHLALLPLPALTPAFRAAAAALERGEPRTAPAPADDAVPGAAPATPRTPAGPFSGDPTTLLDGGEEDAEEGGGVEAEEGDAPAAPAPKPERFREVHRLAFVIESIEHDTAVVPRGAYAVTPQHHVAENRLFAGLDAAELTVGGGSAANAPADTAWAAALLHFREPEGAKRKGALGRAAAVGVGDFLDPIADDRLAPLVWRVRVDADAGRVTARSLLWPGYHFAAAIGGPAFGGVYVGDGRRNDDLVFQAPPPSDATPAV